MLQVKIMAAISKEHKADTNCSQKCMNFTTINLAGYIISSIKCKNKGTVCYDYSIPGENKRYLHVFLPKPEIQAILVSQYRLG